MKYWTICYPGDKGEVVYETLSDEDIIQQYYPYWWGKMIDKFGLEECERTYSKQDCIDDWVIIHWATESAIEENKPDRIADLLEEAANCIQHMQELNQQKKESVNGCG